MLEKICSFFLISVVLSSVAFGYSGGSGTPVDPYLISSGADIQELSNTVSDWDKDFKQTADINLTAYSDLKIGDNYLNPFTGTYDGDSYIISNYTYSYDDDYAALFGYTTSDSVIKNVKLEDVSVTAPTSNYVAALVGNNYGTVSFCSCFRFCCCR